MYSNEPIWFLTIKNCFQLEPFPLDGSVTTFWWHILCVPMLGCRRHRLFRYPLKYLQDKIFSTLKKKWLWKIKGRESPLLGFSSSGITRNSWFKAGFQAPRCPGQWKLPRRVFTPRVTTRKSCRFHDDAGRYMYIHTQYICVQSISILCARMRICFAVRTIKHNIISAIVQEKNFKYTRM